MSDRDDQDKQEFAHRHGMVEAGGSVAVAGIKQVVSGVPGVAEELNPLVQHLTELVDKLAAEADWEAEQFLEYAGCTSAARVVAEEVDEDFMLDCLSYLEWVESLLEGLDCPSDRRSVIIRASRLFVNASSKLAVCKKALATRASVDHSYSGAEIVRLGEIGLGFETALANLDTLEGQRVRKILIDDPDYSESPHLARGRVEVLRSDPPALGNDVAEEMWKHLEGCPVCAETYRDEMSSGNSSDPRLSR